MADAINPGNFFQEIMGRVPEFESCVVKARESNASSGLDSEDLNHLICNPYSLLYELLNEILIPALNSPIPPRSDLLARCFGLLERVADSGDSYVRGNLSFAVGDFLLGDLGAVAYIHGGPAFRALMSEVLAEYGQPVPDGWQ